MKKCKTSLLCHFCVFFGEKRMIRVNGGIGGIEKSPESVPDQEEQREGTTGLEDAMTQRVQHADKTLHRIPVMGEKESQGTLARINTHVAWVRSSQKTLEVTKNVENTTREKSFDEMLCEEHFRQIVGRSNTLGTSPETEPFVTQFNALFIKYEARDENNQELPLTEKQSILKKMEAILVAWEQRGGLSQRTINRGEVNNAMKTLEKSWYDKQKPHLYDKYKRFYKEWASAKIQREKDFVILRHAALAEKDLVQPEPTKAELRALHDQTQQGLEYDLQSRAQLPQVVISNKFIGKVRKASFGTDDMRPQREMALNRFRTEAYSEVKNGLQDIGGQAWVTLLERGYNTFAETDEQEDFLRSIYKHIETLRELQKKIEKKA